nr:hypothetical protein CFP56_52529 [Quercus suber]
MLAIKTERTLHQRLLLLGDLIPRFPGETKADGFSPREGRKKGIRVRRPLSRIGTLRVEPEHACDRLAFRPRWLHARRALDGPWFFHQGRIEIRRNSAADDPYITGDAAGRRGGGGGPPDVIGGVGEETGVRFGEERGPTTIALRQDDLVEELDGWVFGTGGFAVVDEFVEGLGFAEQVHVFTVAVWHAFDELVHVEVVDETGFPSVARCGI